MLIVVAGIAVRTLILFYTPPSLLFTLMASWLGSLLAGWLLGWLVGWMLSIASVRCLLCWLYSINATITTTIITWTRINNAFVYKYKNKYNIYLNWKQLNNKWFFLSLTDTHTLSIPFLQRVDYGNDRAFYYVLYW